MAMVSKEEDVQEDGAACIHEGRPFGDKKAKSCITLDIPFYIRLFPSEILFFVWKTFTQRGPPVIGNAFVLFRVRSIAQAAASRVAG